MKITELTGLLENLSEKAYRPQNSLPSFFKDETEYLQWKDRLAQYDVQRTELTSGIQQATIGIDSGSTTTKIVVLDEGLQKLHKECQEKGTILQIKGGCSTGYGEDLIKAAFQMDAGIIETIAHYMAAKHINKDVSFILDIGGQDMKAIFTNGGIINRIEINEACSSGCGSFISTFVIWEHAAPFS